MSMMPAPYVPKGLLVQPPLIEESNFTLGWSPDGLNETTDSKTLLDVNNLIIDRNTLSLQTRWGYRRLREEFSATFPAVTASHYIHQITHFGTGDHNYLIAVITDLSASADNVQLYRVNLNGNSIARIDTAGVTWANPDAMFWFMAIDGKLYGGSKGNTIFSWDPTGPTWTADAATPVTKTWVDATGAGVTTATQYGRDYAWTGKERVSYNSHIFTPNSSIKYDIWDTGVHYTRGDRVSRKADGYFRSYRCTDDHTSSSATRPDDGGDWNTVWKRVKLAAPQDEDGVTNSDWTYFTEAAHTSIAAWFADRLFLRFDGQGDNSRLQYSAPVKPEKGEDIPNTVWNPKDWAPGNDNSGQGGGWIPFNDGKHGGVITALHAYGQYLIVFKRRAVWVLSGTDDTSWSVRRLTQGVGAVGSRAVTEIDGLVYFMSDDGLYATDGTAVSEVPGNHKVQQWFKSRFDSQMVREATDGHEAQLFHYHGFVGISIPDASDSTMPYVTLFYDPPTQGFWKTDLPVLSWSSYRDDGVEKHAFARAPENTSTPALDLIYIYHKSNDNDQDDTGVDTYAGTDIAWYLRTAWLVFGTLREQRRIRRVWWVVKGAISMTINQYRDWHAASAASITHTGASDAGYVEGVWMPDSHAMSMKLSGTGAPVAVFGYAVDTEPRRRRYHN